MDLDWVHKRVVVTGGAGFLGSHLVEALQIQWSVSPDRITVPHSAVLDLRRWENCQKAVEGQDIVIHLVGVVGGIGINREKPGQFFYDNLIWAFISSHRFLKPMADWLVKRSETSGGPLIAAGSR